MLEATGADRVMTGENVQGTGDVPGGQPAGRNLAEAGYPPEKLIFLLGIMPRSGTNYLFDLILAHPGTTASRLPEDHFLSYSNHLDLFVQSVVGDMKPEWGCDRAQVYGGLRRGLVSLLADPAEQRRIVAKSPSVANLDRFFDLFPTSQLIILVRDGRAVVESALRSFKNWTADWATYNWAVAARRILRFREAYPDRQGQVLLMRYEDLYTHQTQELKRMYAFLGLDTAGIDFEALRNIPVRGSSRLRGEQDAPVHWKPVAKTDEFNPIERFAHWTPAQHARFNWLAGAELRAFGYTPQAVPGWAPYWQVYNRWKDARQAARRWRPFIHRQLNRLRRK